MLRSVVGAAAANMMLVQCNSDVPISLACSASGATVQTTASSEPRPWGDLMVCRQAGDSGEPVPQTTLSARKSVSSTHIRCRMTPMRRASATVARFDPGRRANLCGPGSEPCRAPPMHHDRRSLAQGAPEFDVAGLGDPAREIALNRPVSGGRQADPGPDLPRGGEPGGVISTADR